VMVGKSGGEPGSIMLATQASMAAEPVPETGTVKSFLVCARAHNLARAHTLVAQKIWRCAKRDTLKGMILHVLWSSRIQTLILQWEESPVLLILNILNPA
jgi:hypothetical protein